MAVTFEVDVMRISKSQLIFNTLLAFLGSDNKAEVISTFIKYGPSKTLDLIRETTAPTHVIFDAVMDNRTTEVCRRLNGKVWPIGSTNIQSPAIHWGCRSSLRYFKK